MKSLGAKLGKVIQIVEGGIAPPAPGPIFEKAMMRADGGAVAPVMEGQKQIIHLSVDVTFAIE